MIVSHLLFCSVFYVLTAAIWSQPAHYTNGSDIIWFDHDYSVDLQYDIPYKDSDQHVSNLELPICDRAMLTLALERTFETIHHKNIVPWKLHPRNSDFEPVREEYASIVKRVMVEIVSEQFFESILPFHTVHLSEAYVLDITSDGSVSVLACSTIGINHGLTTLTQLFFKHGSHGVYTNLAPIYIADAPKFAHRGLNLDVSRSFYGVGHIERTLDAMAYNKMNRLHLHITDSQAWPLEVPSMSDLAKKGAYHPSMIYSTGDLKQIQQYGTSLGIEVYLEIDMPGHTSSIFHSYPEIIAAYNIQPHWDTVAAEPPSGTMKLNSTAVYDFLDKLWDDLLSRISPYSNLMHTGGDEVNIKAYEYDDTVKSSDPAVVQPLLQRFVDKAHSMIIASGMTPTVWEEMLLQHNISLGKDVIVQTWLGSASIAKVVEAGHKVIVGTHTHWYLDCGHGAWLDSQSNADSNYPDWCGPRKNWRKIYSLDPLAGVPEDLHHLVIGGEVSLWSEQTDEVNLDVMLWPRTAAAAEVLWSGARDMSKQSEASRRLTEMRERLVARGVRAEPVRMAWCEMEGGYNQP